MQRTIDDDRRAPQHPREDVYVVFSGMSGDSKAEIAAHVNPLVFWIWLGAAIMMAGR